MVRLETADLADEASLVALPEVAVALEAVAFVAAGAVSVFVSTFAAVVLLAATVVVVVAFVDEVPFVAAAVLLLTWFLSFCTGTAPTTLRADVDKAVPFAFTVVALAAAAVVAAAVVLAAAAVVVAPAVVVVFTAAVVVADALVAVVVVLLDAVALDAALACALRPRAGTPACTATFRAAAFELVLFEDAV